MTGFDKIVRLPERQGALSDRSAAQERTKAEIEDLALRFRSEVKAEISKHRGSKAIGVVGSFVVNIEAHRACYAKKLDAIRAGADAATVFLADEAGREIDALTTKEIKRVRDAGHVEFEAGAADDQIPSEIHKIGLSANQLEVIARTAGPLAEETRFRHAGHVEFEPGAADHQIPSEIHKIDLSDNQLEVIKRAAEPLAEETRRKFLQRVAAVLPVRGQINDDEVSAAVHRALSDIIRNSAVWKEWNQNSHPTLQ
jgi:hypothetical protein